MTLPIRRFFVLNVGFRNNDRKRGEISCARESGKAKHTKPIVDNYLAPEVAFVDGYKRWLILLLK
ncbi:MAG TPA: hypothetical protein PLD25_13560 [Chloroflexota bacterium]|nr:hypothetical protein [Chloroflexota bacterium]